MVTAFPPVVTPGQRRTKVALTTGKTSTSRRRGWQPRRRRQYRYGRLLATATKEQFFLTISRRLRGSMLLLLLLVVACSLTGRTTEVQAFGVVVGPGCHRGSTIISLVAKGNGNNAASTVSIPSAYCGSGLPSLSLSLSRSSTTRSTTATCRCFRSGSRSRRHSSSLLLFARDDNGDRTEQEDKKDKDDGVATPMTMTQGDYRLNNETTMMTTADDGSGNEQGGNNMPPTMTITGTAMDREVNNNNDFESRDERSKSSLFMEWLQYSVLAGMEPSPEIAAIVTIYFVEGALGLARLAQTYLLKDELGLGPAELSAFSGIFVVPWTIKPLYGFLTDAFPLAGYRRKSYLILMGILGGISYAVLGQDAVWDHLSTGAALSGTVAALLLSSAAIAFSDVVADGIVVARTREAAEKQAQAAAAAAAAAAGGGTEATEAAVAVEDDGTAGGLQSLCWGASAVGGLLSAYFSGSLLEVMSTRAVFGITAVLPFMVALIALQMDERPTTTKKDKAEIIRTTIDENNREEEEEDDRMLEGVKEQMSSLWEALQRPAIWRPALFLFLWQATPTSDGAFFFFLTNELGFGPEFMGRVRLVTSVASLVGIWLYQQYLRKTKIKNILLWSTVVSFPLGLIPPLLLITRFNQQLGIPDQALIFGDDVVLAALGQIAFLPTLVLAARICPPGIEAVLFATLMSIFNGASTVGTELGALLTKWFSVTESNFDNLALLTVICNVTSLFPLACLGWLDGAGDVSEDDSEKQQQQQLQLQAQKMANGDDGGGEERGGVLRIQEVQPLPPSTTALDHNHTSIPR